MDVNQYAFVIEENGRALNNSLQSLLSLLRSSSDNGGSLNIHNDFGRLGACMSLISSKIQELSFIIASAECEIKYTHSKSSSSAATKTQVDIKDGNDNGVVNHNPSSRINMSLPTPQQQQQFFPPTSMMPSHFGYSQNAIAPSSFKAIPGGYFNSNVQHPKPMRYMPPYFGDQYLIERPSIPFSSSHHERFAAHPNVPGSFIHLPPVCDNTATESSLASHHRHSSWAAESDSSLPVIKKKTTSSNECNSQQFADELLSPSTIYTGDIESKNKACTAEHGRQHRPKKNKTEQKPKSLPSDDHIITRFVTHPSLRCNRKAPHTQPADTK